MTFDMKFQNYSFYIKRTIQELIYKTEIKNKNYIQIISARSGSTQLQGYIAVWQNFQSYSYQKLANTLQTGTYLNQFLIISSNIVYQKPFLTNETSSSNNTIIIAGSIGGSLLLLIILIIVVIVIKKKYDHNKQTAQEKSKTECTDRQINQNEKNIKQNQDSNKNIYSTHSIEAVI